MLMRQWILLLLSILFPLCGYGCTYTFIGSPYTVNYGNIIVQRDAPQGQAISNEIFGSLAHAWTCKATGGEGSSAGIKSGLLSYAFTSSNGRRVFNTNLPGVGISLGFYKDTTAGAARYSGTNFIGGDNFMTISWSSNADDLDINDFQPIIQFWKTGNITSGSVTGQLASFIAYTAQYRGGEMAGEIPINAGTGSITQVACSINTPSIIFDIGEVLASRFGTEIGTTPPEGQKTKNLIMDCDPEANINVMLTGVKNPDVNDDSVLALTGQNTAGVASGVGVQLIYNNMPLTLDSRIVMKRSSGGQEMFPLTARYYQTATTVTTGTANAAATLNLTYQ